MKLLIELQNHDPVKTLFEGEGANKKLYLESKFLEFDSPNKNKRIYRSEHHDHSVKQYIDEKVKGGSAWGEIDHPEGPVVSLKNTSHRLVDMWKEGSNWYGKAIVVDNANGNLVKGLIESGGSVGVSSRGMGNLKALAEGGIMEVQPGYKLITAGDLVSDPSAHGAFVKGILENVEYFYDESNGAWIPEHISNVKKKLHKMTLQQIEEVKVNIFNNFLSELRKNV